MITAVDKAYAAAIVDGEGCISLAKVRVRRRRNPTYVLRVSVSSTTSDLLDWLKSRWAGYIAAKKVPSHRKPVGEWIISSRKARDFLTEIRPYMIIKTRQAWLALEASAQTRCAQGDAAQTLREGYYFAMKALNRRGR